MSRNNDPKISVIMPAYNAERYISEAIESILCQTFPDFELIILDDNSSDRTWELVSEYAQKDARIIAVHNEKNLDIAGNRNKGIGMSKGKYIVWQDADDVSLPTRLEKLYGYMESHPEVGICGSYLQSFKEGKDLDIRKYETEDASLRKNIFRFSPVAQPTAIIRKEIFTRIGVYNVSSSPAEDIEMSFRIGELYEFGNVPEVLLRYREHESSATFTRSKKQISETCLVRSSYMKNAHYTCTLTDRLVNGITWIFQYLPQQINVPIFKIYRFILGLVN